MNRLLMLLLLLASCQSVEQKVTDIDGNTYAVQEIKGLLWMTENLRVTKDRAGQEVTFFFPNEDKANAEEFGLLYDYPTACSVCPNGWRLPTNADWEKLFALDQEGEASQWKDAQLWQGEVNSDNYGFSVLPAGYGNSGAFDNAFLGKAILTSETKDNEHDVWTYILEKGKTSIRKAPQHPTYGFSVRCVKNK